MLHFEDRLNQLPKHVLSVEYVKRLIKQYKAGKHWYAHYILTGSSSPEDIKLGNYYKEWMETNQKELEVLMDDLDEYNDAVLTPVPLDEWLILEVENITKCIGNYHIKAQLIEKYKSAVKAHNLNIKSIIGDVELHEKNLRAWVSQNKVLKSI